MARLNPTRLFRDERWKRHPLASKVEHYPAMLANEERRMLSFLAYHLASRSGKIVDLGCYLGGSTAALIEGIRQAKVGCTPADPIVVSYDLFVTNHYMVDHSLAAHGVKPGEDFLHVFSALLGKDRSYVRPVAGDLRKQSWSGRPIDLLFVDILWDWDINQHVISQFYTALIPQRSVIAHQDYIYTFYPWIPISMEYFCERGFFEFGPQAIWSTVAFLSKRALDADARAIDFRTDLTLATKERLLSRTAERFTGYDRALLELSRSVLLFNEFRPDEARHIVLDVARRNQDDPVVCEHVRMVKENYAAFFKEAA